MLTHPENCADGCLEDHRQACMDSEGSFAWIYFTSGGTEKIDLTHMKGSTIHAWWFNPRDGQCYDSDGSLLTRPFASISEKTIVTFTTPTAGKENDWVLVLDDAEVGYAAPGSNTSNLQSEKKEEAEDEVFFPTVE
ncbi:putative collagen-binding domain-containing protein [Paenibacillus phyllosphaerae]|nr:putative collagen-binding domain-containing protein [Paenibacillus phyllosphaerae]